MTPITFLHEFRNREVQDDVHKATWYITAAVSLASANAGAQLPDLYKMATADLDLEDAKIIQRRIKEAILKTSVLYGIPRALNALLPLFRSLEEDAIDHYAPRTNAAKTESEGNQREQKAIAYFNTLWTPKAGQANRDMLLKYHKDLYLLDLKMAYECWISEDAILSPVETQMCNAAALTCNDSAVQAMWHTRGIVRHGGSMEQAQFAQDIALAVAKEFDARTGEITPVQDIDFDDATPH